MYLLGIGHIVPDVLVPAVEKKCDVFERQPFILWDCNVSDVLGLDTWMDRRLRKGTDWYLLFFLLDTMSFRK